MSNPEFAAVIERHVSAGARVESNDGNVATLVYGRRMHPLGHVLHLIMSIVTGGVWLVVWIIHALMRREKRITIHAAEAQHVAGMTDQEETAELLKDLIPFRKPTHKRRTRHQA